MNILLLSSTAAAGLFVAAAVHAGADTPPAPVRPPPSVLMDATMSMVRDIELHDDPHAPMRARLDALAAFRHSPDTAQKLLKVYGSEQPWTLSRALAAKDRQDYLGHLAARHYASEHGETVDWADMRITMSLDKASRNMVVRGDWPSLVAEDKDVRFTLRDMRLTSRQTRGFGDLWFGDAQVDIAGMKLDAKGAGLSMALDDIRFKSVIRARPKSVEIGYGVTVKAINAGGERVDNFTLAMRVTNIDKSTMLELKALDNKRGADIDTPQQQLAAITPMLKVMGNAAIKRGTALEVDELSARFHGNTVSLKGRVSLEGASDADLDSMTTIAKKIVAHFDVKVPVGVVRDVSSAVATKQASAQASGAANPQGVAQIAQSITDIVIGKVVGNGYARIENDVLVTSIDFRGGVLRINGKELALPSFAPPAGQQPAPSVARASPALLHARRIEERCMLPDYPSEVVRLDQALRLSMRFTVSADGTLRDLALATPSRFAAYDQAVLAAATRCVYIPALRNGQPVDMPMTWQVVREPGSAHP